MAVKVRQHKGAWWVFIDYHGKRKAKRIGASKRAAETVAEKIQAKIALGQFEIKDEQAKKPLDAYFRNRMETYVKAHCKERTAYLYQWAFNHHLLPAFGQKEIAAISREEVKRLAYSLLAQKKSRSTVKAVLAPLRALFNHAMEDGDVAGNPALRILKRTRAEDGGQTQAATFLTKEELSLLLRTCQEQFPTAYPLFSLLARTGMRFGEALGLQWKDVDFHGGFIEIQRTFSHQRLSTPKNSKRRRVDMSQQLSETLKALLLERKKETLRHGWGDVPPWIFMSEEGTPLNMGNVRHRIWRKLLKKAGLRELRVHDLRHTFASLLIQNGESLTYVKEQLGHHSIKITVDTYGHLVPGGNRQAVDKLDDLEQTTIRNPTATDHEGAPMGQDATT